MACVPKGLVSVFCRARVSWADINVLGRYMMTFSAERRGGLEVRCAKAHRARGASEYEMQYWDCNLTRLTVHLQGDSCTPDAVRTRSYISQNRQKKYKIYVKPSESSGDTHNMNGEGHGLQITTSVSQTIASTQVERWVCRRGKPAYR